MLLPNLLLYTGTLILHLEMMMIDVSQLLIRSTRRIRNNSLDMIQVLQAALSSQVSRLVRLSFVSYHSRSPIKLLGSEDASTTQRLVHIIGHLEREVEVTVDDSAAPPSIAGGHKCLEEEPASHVTPA
jgi:hypothetical protein